MEDGKSIIPKLIITLMVVATAVLLVAAYHCISVGWCNRRRRLPPSGLTSQHQPRRFLFRHEEPPCSFETSVAKLIPAYKYQKGELVKGEEDDGACAICLCEFEEGEELRTLPECMHTFHSSCIDMWLFSHSNCPVCRTDATPSPHVLIHFLSSELDRPDSRRNSHSSPNLPV